MTGPMDRRREVQVGQDPCPGKMTLPGQVLAYGLPILNHPPNRVAKWTNRIDHNSTPAVTPFRAIPPVNAAEPGAGRHDRSWAFASNAVARTGESIETTP